MSDMYTTWLYKAGEEPAIFSGDKDIKKAKKDGWVESPDLIEEASEPVEENDGEIASEGENEEGSQSSLDV